MNLFFSFDKDQLAHIKLLKKDEIYILFQDDLKLVIQVKDDVMGIAVGREYHKFPNNQGYIRTRISLDTIQTAEPDVPIITAIQLVNEGRF